MKKRGLFQLCGAFLLLLLFCMGDFAPAGTVYGEVQAVDYGQPEEDEAYSDYAVAAELLESRLLESGQQLNAEQRLYDLYGKFSLTEQEEISEWIVKKETEGQVSIRVVVTALDMYYEKYFLEEFADRLCDNGYASEDLVIMLLNLDEYNRGACIQGYGICEYRVNDHRIEYILDDIIACFRSEDYSAGVKLFATEAAYYAVTADYFSRYEDNSFAGKMKRMPWLFLFGLPGIVTLVGMFSLACGKISAKGVNGRTYMQSAGSGLTAKRDEYVRTSVSRTYCPRSSGSAGGGSSGRSSGGGGTSRGGRSHSGGSRRF